ncbi:MAG: VOC family protein [Chlamydiota bacterium]|nr:VOC family protein [Chlamydiota bacterium]
MKNQGMNLAWIVAEDFEQTLKFYTEVLGLKLISRTDEYKWAELEGEDGAMIGVAGKSDESPVMPGQNAVLTYTVENIEEATSELKEKGVELIGAIQEVPGHVKMQLFKDPNGTLGQLVQLLRG